MKIDWRAAHSWLRGHSDARLGKPELRPDQTYSHAAYQAGRANVESRQMATAVRRRGGRRTVAAPPKLGKTTWAILTPDGATLRENSYGPGANLAMAQHMIQRTTAIELTVERRDLFGPPATLYRVTRDEDSGIIRSTTISRED